MTIGSVVKRGLIGIISLFIGLILIGRIHSAFLQKPYDPFNGQKPDIQKGPSQPVISYAETTMLGESDYRASLAKSRYDSNKGDDWDYIYIRVGKVVDGFEYPFFKRWLHASKVSTELLTKDVEDIVFYDADTRRVVFDVGITNYSCTLPGEGSARD